MAPEEIVRAWFCSARVWPGKPKRTSRGLEAGASGTDIFAERGHIGSVGTDATCVDRESQNFRLLDAQASVVEFGEAVSFGWYEAI